MNLTIPGQAREQFPFSSEDNNPRPRKKTSAMAPKLNELLTTDSLLDMVKDKKFSLITEVMGGNGDIMCAAKIARYLHEKLGVNLENIVLGIGLPHPSELLKNTGITQVNLSDPRLLQGDVVIVGPGIWTDFNPEYFRGNSRLPILLVREYGFTVDSSMPRTDIRKYSLGLAPSALGVLLSPELLDWSSSEKTQEERLSNLEFLPTPLQEAILGEPYSEESVRSFSEGSKLYFGYAHHESLMRSFLQAVVSMNVQLQDSADLCFYFMGDQVLRFSEADVEQLKSQGVGTVEYVEGPLLSQKTVYKISENEKTLRIIIGPLDPMYVNFMHKISEYETLSTGDQSFSEAISAGKIPVYETYLHKKVFFKEFRDVLPPNLQEKMLSFYEESFDFPICYDLNPEKLASFFVERRLNPEIGDLSKQVIQHIKANCDFGPKFERVLSELFRSGQGADKVVELTSP